GKSQALADYWQQPITADQLQAEMDRMAQHIKQPEVLRELFAALGNDPFVIAECLARPALAERVTNLYGHDEGPLKFWRARAENQMPKLMAQGSANYTLPRISDGAGSFAAVILATEPANLKGYWKCDETSGTTLADSSGNSKNLTITGTINTNYWLG